MINPIKSNTVTTIRVDPHLSFKALKDKLLKQINITLEIGHEKNPNKNAVAEKAIQELEEDKKLLPNNRIRRVHSGKSYSFSKQSHKILRKEFQRTLHSKRSIHGRKSSYR